MRDLEKRLLATESAGGAATCKKPDAPGAPTDVPLIGQLQVDLLVTAMACDLTRVGTIQWENSVGGLRFSWLGATRGHHDMSHDADSNADTKAMLVKINAWLAEQQFGYLLKRLQATPEGEGNMLDNTLVLWCNEPARGNSHSRNNMSYVLAGKAGGALKAGRYLKYTKTNHNNLLVSILMRSTSR